MHCTSQQMIDCFVPLYDVELRNSLSLISTVYCQMVLILSLLELLKHPTCYTRRVASSS